MRSLVVIGVLALMAGCAPRPDPASSAEALKPVHCEGQDQCNKYWSAAQVWVAQNSVYPVQIVTDTLIQTARPKLNDVDLAFIITKEKVGNGYDIVINGGCANMFGCQPHPMTAAASFKRYVRNAGK